MAHQAFLVGFLQVADTEEHLLRFALRLALALVSDLAAVDPAAHAKVSRGSGLRSQGFALRVRDPRSSRSCSAVDSQTQAKAAGEERASGAQGFRV